jgi:hypothetical protein
MKRTVLSVAALLVAASTVWANAAPMPPNPPLVKGPQNVKLVVEVDENAKAPRLEIPQNLITLQLRRGAPGPGADAGPRVPTTIAGLALAGAFVSGGFWLTRRNRTIATIALAFLVVGGTLMADIRVQPKPAPKTTPLTLPANLAIASDKLTLEITDKGDAVKLIVPKGMGTEVKPDIKPDSKREE